MKAKPTTKVKAKHHTNQPLALMMAGGTGGHIFPALAVAEQLVANGWQVHWLGSIGGMEAELVPKENIEISLVPIKGLRGKGLLSLIAAPFKLVVAILQAIAVLRRVKPSVVLGMGGFVSGPGGVAAKILGVPLVLHEQNAIAGLTNRWLAKVADKILLGFPGTQIGNKKSEVVGNPIRGAITQIRSLGPLQRGLKVLVFGGSRGAQAINEQLPKYCQFVSQSHALGQPLCIWHQVGKGKLEVVKGQYEALKIPTVSDGELFPNDDTPMSVKLSEFIFDMEKAYAWADIVICRAGALTVSELAIIGKPSILVPFPFAVDDHQTHNAKFLESEGAAYLVPQEELTSERLSEILTELSQDKEKLALMGKRAKKIGKPMAAFRVAQVCEMFSAR